MQTRCLLRCGLTLAAVYLTPPLCATESVARQSITVASPDDRFTIEFALGDGGRPVYSVNRFGAVVIQSSGLGVVVYVNRRHLESQLDQLLPLYEEWGLAGIKFGFVQHGSQKWTAWMHEAIRKCAEHRLTVDVHDEYRMTGWQRTYPNFMTAEGIGGDETRPPHEQALANLFNRMIAGPADHTFCYYSGYVDETSSHASQLAKSICFFSPWQFLFWYDRPAAASDEPDTVAKRSRWLKRRSRRAKARGLRRGRSCASTNYRAWTASRSRELP
jgi:alpha-glucosidase